MSAASVTPRVCMARLPCGQLRLRLETEQIDLEELVSFASRLNPARKYSFVSRVIGKHIPTQPRRLREIAGLLAARIPDVGSGPVLFVGLAEMGVTLGQAVFEAWIGRTGARAVYIDSTRFSLAETEFIEFSEEHSHASAHRLHIPTDAAARRIFFAATTVVLVDDEVTTGRTAENLIAAIAEARGTTPEHLTTVVASVVSWAQPSGMTSVSLAQGEMEFLDSTVHQTVEPSVAPSGYESVVSDSTGSRGGLRSAEQLPDGIAVDVEAGKKYLVVGTGEFGFLPLRFAEQIESLGAEAFLQSTSRSPLYLGDAIRHVREFPSLCGGQWREFLYNVPDAHRFDGVLLCVEASDLVPPQHPLREVPGLRLIALPRE